jgi:hypothetical protein
MSRVPTRTLWRVLDANWIDEDPDVSVISVVLQANGKEYVVVCSGPKGMLSDEFTSAIQAAATTLIRANGGSIEVADPQMDMFDTGDQRAS